MNWRGNSRQWKQTFVRWGRTISKLIARPCSVVAPPRAIATGTAIVPGAIVAVQLRIPMRVIMLAQRAGVAWSIIARAVGTIYIRSTGMTIAPGRQRSTPTIRVRCRLADEACDQEAD